MTGKHEESDVPHYSLTAIMDQTEAAVNEQEALSCFYTDWQLNAEMGPPFGLADEGAVVPAGL